MKALSLIIQKIWPMLKVFFADKWTQGTKTSCMYLPNLLMPGHKNCSDIAMLWPYMKLHSCEIHINPFPNKPWFLRVCSTSLENTVGKGETARKEQFLLFPQHF